MYAVLINEGPLTAEDNAVYFCTEKPTGVLVEFESEDRAMVKFARFLVFTPTNGTAPGKERRVPVERVVSVTDES